MFLRKLFRFLPRSALGRALGAFNRGDLETAARLFEEILRSNPQPAADVVLCACETYLELAASLESRGDWAGAVQALERAAQLRPRWADVQLRLGRLYEKLDQPQRARDAYLRAIEVNPRYFEARLNLARLLMHLEDRSAALQQLQEAARSGPEYASQELQELVDDLPDANWASRDSRSRLEQVFSNLLAGPPSPVAAALETARAALRAGDNGLAIAELKKLLQLHPEFPDLHNLLGVAYDNEEMTDDAIEEFEISLRLNSNYLDARLNLGLALFERGRDAEAQRHLRTVADHESGNEVADSVLAQIESRSGAR
jgi:tetratricopeptide (TPR) repeat protein